MNFSKDQISEMPDFFDRYILQASAMSLFDALEQTYDLFQIVPLHSLETVGDNTYAPGKWTIKDIIQHLLDMERVLAYRALMFARNNPIAQPSIDENSYSSYAYAERRSLQELIDDFRFQRQSTIRLFQSFNDQMVQRTGIAADKNISVLALGFVIAGHTTHHLRIIEEKYLPLVRNEL